MKLERILAMRTSRRGVNFFLGSCLVGQLMPEKWIYFCDGDREAIDPIFLYNLYFSQKVEPVFLKNQGKLATLREGGELGNIGLLRMYFPIYRQAEAVYEVPWYVLWVMHDAESTVSLDDRAFAGGVYYGAMQRSLEFFPKVNVEEAARGYEYLSGVSQNHYDDWKEIMWASSKIGKDRDRAMLLNPDLTDDEGLLSALSAYCGENEAKVRMERIKFLEEIFTEELEESFEKVDMY